MGTTPRRLQDYGAISSSVLTPELTFEHFLLLGIEMAWLATFGKRLLERQEPLDYPTWHELFSRAFQAYSAGNERFTFRHYFLLVIERGVKDLRHFVENHLDVIRTNDDHQEVCQNWFNDIVYQLGMGARLGLNSQTNQDPNTTVRLLNDLAEIAQRARRQDWLEQTAIALFPSYQEETRRIFVKHHTNW